MIKKNNIYTLVKGKRTATLITDNADFRAWNLSGEKAALFKCDKRLITRRVTANALCN